MDEKELLHLKIQLNTLTVFRELLNDSVITALISYFSSFENGDENISVSRYCDFVSKLYNENEGNLSLHIENLCNASENIYVKLVGKGKKPAEYIEESLNRELKILKKVSSLTPEELSQPISHSCPLPDFSVSNIDIEKNYKLRAENISKFGYGKYAANRMFFVDAKSSIIPVKNADNISLKSLVGYEQQKNRIIENTKALLHGKPAANILLTGDAGTGKSSTIKAIGNLFFSEGLRIIEIHKDQLHIIPEILDELAENPLKFILFIDDLSFSSDDDSFNGLKAVLEGSVSAKSRNVVIYATSNRRHIISEKFSDRSGDDIHRNETIQEIVSLSNRFGLQITFSKPDKAAYLQIVRGLAELHKINIPVQELEKEAERLALERGGRSARLAKQYIDSLLSN